MAGLEKPFVAITNLFLHWKQSHVTESVQQVDAVLQLLAKASPVICQETAAVARELDVDVLMSLSNVSMAALALKHHRWQLPCASNAFVASLLEQCQSHTIYQLLQRLDSCAPHVALTLRTTMNLRLQESISVEQASGTPCTSSAMVAVLYAAHSEQSLPPLLLTASPTLLRRCADHKAAAVRKAACACLGVIIRHACKSMAESESVELEAIAQWAVTGVARTLASDRDCTVRIHACHEAKNVVGAALEHRVGQSLAGCLLLPHLGCAAASTANKRVVMAASKDLTSLASLPTCVSARGNEVRQRSCVWHGGCIDEVVVRTQEH